MRRGIATLLALFALAGAPAAWGQAGVSYTVPADNPFAGQAGARPEIWAYGFRNPWRFSFDKATGDLAIGDVGQDAVEEIDFAPAGTGAGANYGWNCFEGSQPFAGCSAPGHVAPAHEYTSTQAACSVIGGYVVRDPALAIAGRYLYGDFCTGELRTIKLAAGGASDDRSLNLAVPALAAFGQDAAGRLYAVSFGGPVFRLRAGLGPIGALLEPVGVFSSPVYATSPDSTRLFVVEKAGTIKVVGGTGAPTTFLDITPDVSSTDQERGLLSVAFARDYATSGRFYIDYTDSNGDIRIEEVRRSASDPNVADPSSRRLVLTQEHRQFANHNAGQLQFGPDGYLYATLGDGGGAGDPLGNAQNLGTLLGKMIRIDPRQPAGNTVR
jgi:glucose/arabinose dehydrogenase